MAQREAQHRVGAAVHPVEGQVSGAHVQGQAAVHLPADAAGAAVVDLQAVPLGLVAVGADLPLKAVEGQLRAGQDPEPALSLVTVPHTGAPLL